MTNLTNSCSDTVVLTGDIMNCRGPHSTNKFITADRSSM